MRGAYPGTFDPPTIAHLAIADAARRQCGLEHVDLIVNSAPLGKRTVTSLSARLAMLEAVVAERPWLSVQVTDLVHLADIAAGYDVLVIGADKWAQLLDPVFYESVAARDAAIARLPHLAVAPRHDFALPDVCDVLEVELSAVSSTAARSGRLEFVVPEARPFIAGA